MKNDTTRFFYIEVPSIIWELSSKGFQFLSLLLAGFFIASLCMYFLYVLDEMII